MASSEPDRTEFEVEEEAANGFFEGDCHDSPFEDDESSSESEEEISSSEEEENFPETEENDNEPELPDDDHGFDNGFGAEPYMFQPVLPPGVEARRPPVGDDRNRLETLDWCRCGNCVLMRSVTESVCCQEVDCIKTKMAETDTPDGCLRDHEAFWRVALDPIILDIAYASYGKKQRRGVGNYAQGNLNARYRYTGYHQVVRWCWGILGKYNRVPIPSCVIDRIATTFPPPPGQPRRGFLYAPLD